MLFFLLFVSTVFGQTILDGGFEQTNSSTGINPYWIQEYQPSLRQLEDNWIAEFHSFNAKLYQSFNFSVGTDGLIEFDLKIIINGNEEEEPNVLAIYTNNNFMKFSRNDANYYPIWRTVQIEVFPYLDSDRQILFFFEGWHSNDSTIFRVDNVHFRNSTSSTENSSSSEEDNQFSQIIFVVLLILFSIIIFLSLLACWWHSILKNRIVRKMELRLIS